MIPPWQTPALRRVLFVLGNLAAGLAILLACVVPVRDLLAERDREILRQRTTLARLQALAAREAAMPAIAKETAPARASSSRARPTASSAPTCRRA
jgi:hypothetical protein